eukprot:GDKJ01021593.1.p1 GENE.GDKJ01021593.1~~GDKJ01021593.1.p1  ORF type:complete len:199 (+),score=67.62 GDKJ01021593.1:19-615(+)
MHNIAKDMIESDEAFRSHFDRSSTDFHHGDPTVVPVGGARVPDSMKGGSVDWMSLPVVEEAPVDIGPKATRLMEVRTLLGDLKKSLENVCKPIDAIIRIKEKGLDEAGIDAEIKKREECIAELESFIPKFHDSEERQEFIRARIAEAQKEYADREAYGTLLLDMKRHQSLLFIEQKNLLQEIKKAKQEYLAEQKKNSA